MHEGRGQTGTAEPRAAAAAAATRLRERLGGDCALGLVLGTGLGDLVDRLTDRRVVPAAETDWLAPSRATGHAGRVVAGRLGATRVAVLQGRVHHYEGHPAETLIRGVELLSALGCRDLLLTNAAGGLRPDMVPGELVVLTGHVDLVRRDWTAALGIPVRGAPGDDYDPALGAAALAAARQAGAPARPGVYALLSGPSYETRAEYRLLRRLGADVVGMSTVPEVAAARWLGMRVAAVSVVTNVARPEAPAPDKTLAEDVCRAAAAAAAGVAAILGRLAAGAGDGRPA